MADKSFGAKVYRKQDAEVIADGGVLEVESGGIVYGLPLRKRVRVTRAQLNAAGGLVVLAGVAGRKYTVWAVEECAIGGAVTGATSVDVKDTTPDTPATIAAIPIAVLTQDHWTSHLAAGATGPLIGQAGAAGQGVAVEKNGVDVATATHVDFVITYTLA